MLLKEAVRGIWWFSASLLILVAATFFLDSWNPIDVVLVRVGERASADVYEAARSALDLDRPLLYRFAFYIKHCFLGNFGESVMTGNLVLDDLKRFFPVTLNLATLALIFSFILGGPAGAASAFLRKSIIEKIIRSFIVFGHSVPGFLIAYGVLTLFLTAGIINKTFMEDGPYLFYYLFVGEFALARDSWVALFPASLVLGIIGASYIARMTRNFVIGELNTHYVITARIKRLGTYTILLKHIWPNISGRLVCTVLLAYTQLIEGSVITETIFALPGCGSYITRAILAHDIPVILGTTLTVGAAIIALNTILDVTRRYLGVKKTRAEK